MGTIVPVLLAGVLACEADETTEDDDGSTSAGGMGGAPIGPGPTGPGSGGGGMGGSGMGGEYIPTADDIAFNAMNAIPSGEQILFNDWSFPDRLLSMQNDGSNAIEIFDVYRIWSFSAARGADQLAFSVGDANQEEHYGVTIGDAIQHTFIYDFATESVSVAAYGNINDECHHFSPGDDELYVCRRYDFMPDNTHQTYRLGKITMSDLSFEFVVDTAPNVIWLHPQVTADESELWFTRIQINGGSQTRAVGKLTLPAGTPEVVRGNASAPVLSPSGTRYLYADTNDDSSLYESDLDGGNIVLVADVNGTDATYSPDGTQVVFLVFDDANNCSHVHVAAVDGSQSAAPPMIRDCSTSGEFITDLDWIDVP